MCKNVGMYTKQLFLWSIQIYSYYMLNNFYRILPSFKKKWAAAISSYRKDKILTQNCGVCKLHFMEDYIVRFYKTILPDGTVH